MKYKRTVFNRRKYCACGCGMRVESMRQFVKGHHTRVYKPNITKEKMSLGIRLGIERRKRLMEIGKGLI